MTTILPFAEKGNWYKGNLHCHSTISDGLLSPEELVKLYKDNGYNFLVISDHEVYTDFRYLNEDNFILLPGVEYSVTRYGPNNERLQTYHVNGISGTAEMQKKARRPLLKHMEVLPALDWDGQKNAQKMIDFLLDSGHICTLNHPLWSRTELEDFKDLEGYFALEIFNYGCELESHTGLTSLYWDSLLKRGKKIWAVASDDNHNVLNDSCGGWVCVNARELTHDAIVESMVSGRYYSSTGPEIFDFGLVDGEVFIECSPVNVIHFVATDELNSGFSKWGDGETLTGAKYRLKGNERYIRVECVDLYGKTAWTNPIFLR